MLCADNMKVDVSACSRSPDSSQKSSSTIVTAAADLQQPNTTGDASLTAEAVASNSGEVMADGNADNDGVLLSDETGGRQLCYRTAAVKELLSIRQYIAIHF